MMFGYRRSPRTKEEGGVGVIGAAAFGYTRNEIDKRCRNQILVALATSDVNKMKSYNVLKIIPCLRRKAR